MSRLKLLGESLGELLGELLGWSLGGCSVMRAPLGRVLPDTCLDYFGDAK